MTHMKCTAFIVALIVANLALTPDHNPWLLTRVESLYDF